MVERLLYEQICTGIEWRQITINSELKINPKSNVRKLIAERDVLEDLKKFHDKAVARKARCECKEPKHNYPEMVWCDYCGKYLREAN